MRRRLAGLGLAGCLLATAAGCPADEGERPEPSSSAGPSAGPSSGSVAPDRPTEATTGLPAYGGPPPGAPPSSGPLTTLTAAVDLTPAAPGVFVSPDAAVAAPDGGAYVVLTPEEPGQDSLLVTVGPAPGGPAVTGSVPFPRLDDVWGLHLLPDGTVAVAGELTPVEKGQGDYGFELVDPRAGHLATAGVVPHEEGTVSSSGRSALSADGRRLHLFLSTEARTVTHERLVSVDVATRRVIAARDLADDVAAVSLYRAGNQVAGLLPRPDGGATLVFDASPTQVREQRIPTLLRYDPQLEPAGEPVRVTSLSERAETQDVVGGVDGTVFLLVEVPDGAWILAVPDGGGAGPVLVALDDRIYDYALSVEPGQGWALLPAFEGARAVDLRTGEVRTPVDVGCSWRRDVRAILPGWNGVGALLLGKCDTPRVRTPMLWFVGP